MEHTESIEQTALQIKYEVAEEQPPLQIKRQYEEESYALRSSKKRKIYLDTLKEDLPCIKNFDGQILWHFSTSSHLTLCPNTKPLPENVLTVTFDPMAPLKLN